MQKKGEQANSYSSFWLYNLKVQFTFFILDINCINLEIFLYHHSDKHKKLQLCVQYSKFKMWALAISFL